VLAPSGIVAVLLAPVAGRKLDSAPRVFASVAISIHAFCMIWRAYFTDSADYFTFAAPQFVQGIAMAFFFAPLVSISLGGLEPEKLAAGAGLQNFVRNLMGSFGTSAAITFWDRREALHRTQLSEHVTSLSAPTVDYLSRLDSTGMPPGNAYGVVDRLLTQQSYTLATNDLYWVTSGIMLSLVALVWFSKPPFNRRRA
jgi:DHA2 family multidrug resistance protein